MRIGYHPDNVDFTGQGLDSCCATGTIDLNLGERSVFESLNKNEVAVGKRRRYQSR